MSSYVKLVINEPPSWVKNSATEVSICCNELKRRIGTYQYIMIADNNEEVELIACPKLKDLTFYAAYFRTFQNGIEAEDRILFAGDVVDPNELPYEIDKDYKVFIIYDDWLFTKFDTIRETTTFLVELVDKMYLHGVNDFVVIIGRYLGEGVFRSANKAIKRLLGELWVRV